MATATDPLGDSGRTATSTAASERPRELPPGVQLGFWEEHPAVRSAAAELLLAYATAWEFDLSPVVWASREAPDRLARLREELEGRGRRLWRGCDGGPVLEHCVYRAARDVADRVADDPVASASLCAFVARSFRELARRETRLDASGTAGAANGAYLSRPLESSLAAKRFLARRFSSYPLRRWLATDSEALADPEIRKELEKSSGFEVRLALLVQQEGSAFLESLERLIRNHPRQALRARAGLEDVRSCRLLWEALDRLEEYDAAGRARVQELLEAAESRYGARARWGQGVSPATFVQAVRSLEGVLHRRRRSGHVVEVVKPPYHGGLSNVRCLLRIDGRVTRLFYRARRDRWRKS